jgi:hypothetical protein|tara:strand:+ start:183 stop:359 length:177 start_codon:yes stop_codon:yes gene_type:complete
MMNDEGKWRIHLVSTPDGHYAEVSQGGQNAIATNFLDSEEEAFLAGFFLIRDFITEDL